MKQTVTNRYQVGESVALSDTSLLMYRGFDHALKRDVWVEIYQIPGGNDQSEKQVIYDCIREQVLLMNDWLRNVFDVYDDDDHVYVVGESLRNYVPLSTFLRQTETDEGTRFERMLYALSKVIEFSVRCHRPFSITMERILMYNESVKLIPKYEMQKQATDRSKYQAFEILQQIYTKFEFQDVYRNMMGAWLQHAEKHGNIIDVVDLQLWMEELHRMQEQSAATDQVPNPMVPNPKISNPPEVMQHTIPVRRPDKPDEFDHNPKDHEQVGPRKQVTRILSRQPVWVWTAIAAVCLCILGFAGYNWLNPTITVPDMRGVSYTDAVHTLHKLGIDDSKIERVDSFTPAQKPGYIYAQDPLPDSHIRLSSAVVLRVSKGLPAVALPNVVGMSEQQAKDTLIQAGILPDQISIQEGTASSNSIVVSEQPVAGKTIAANQTVTLVLATNSSVLTMPNLIGLSLQQATDILLKSGLHYEYHIEQASAPSGTVYEQNIQPGQQVDKGSFVTFSVAQ